MWSFSLGMAGAIRSIRPSGGCAHGLPAGACSVCSGGGGGGGGAVRRKGEMSWNDCYSMGQAMKAAQQKTVDNKMLDQMIQARTSIVQKQIDVIHNQISSVNLIRLLPLPAQNAINSIKQTVSENLNRIASNVMNQTALLSENLNKFASMTMNQIALLKEKMQFMINNFTNIMDKLVAIYGEQEAKIKDLIYKNLKKVKKKLFEFFEMIDGSLEQGDYEEAEDHQIMKNLKRVKKKLSGLLEMIDGSPEQRDLKKAEDQKDNSNRKLKDD